MSDYGSRAGDPERPALAPGRRTGRCIVSKRSVQMRQKRIESDVRHRCGQRKRIRAALRMGQDDI